MVVDLAVSAGAIGSLLVASCECIMHTAAADDYISRW